MSDNNKTERNENNRYPQLDPELKNTLCGLLQQLPDARISFLLSGFSPFMGQTADLDEYFIYTVMQRYKLTSRKAVRVMFSPASFYPRDQKSYARGFKQYYERHLGVRTCVFKFYTFYHLQRIDRLMKNLNSYETQNDLLDVGFLCLINSMENMGIVRNFLHNNRENPLEAMPALATGEFQNRLDAVEQLFVKQVFLNLLENGPAAIPRILNWLEKRRATFLRRARTEYLRNARLLGEVNAFYGGGGDPEFLVDMYDYKVRGKNHWSLLLGALDRGVPFMGYSAHAILLGWNHHAMITYTDRNKKASYIDHLESKYTFVRPRKRDYFVLRPMKKMVPLSLIVHYERQVADLRKFELNYFDETVPEDVMSLRNNCAIGCFDTGDDNTRLMGFWSTVTPPHRDKTSEIRYIHYYNGKPCKLRHGEVLSIKPNQPFPSRNT